MMGLMESCLPFPQEIPTLYMDVAEYVAEYVVVYDAEYIADLLFQEMWKSLVVLTWIQSQMSGLSMGD